MIYLLDTNAAISILNNRPTIVRQRYSEAQTAGNSIGLSSIVLFELRYGISKSTRVKENIERLRIFLSGPISVATFDEEDSAIAGDVRAALDARGTPIGSYDLLIAAESLRLGATLVTANVSEFSRVPDLVWEDWTATG